MESTTAMNSQPWALSPSAEKGPRLYQGSQKETRRTKRRDRRPNLLRLKASTRWRDFRERFGAGRDTTSGLMAAPHLGHSAVPTGTSTRQREHAGNGPISFLLSRMRWLRLQATLVRPVAFRSRREGSDQSRWLEGTRAPQRGARGIPSPIMAMMSRWISLVPPPNVKMVWLRACRSRRPRSTAPGEPSTR